MTDKWFEKELKLNQQHEQILARREALLHATEWQLSGSLEMSSTIIQHWNHAKQRNQALLKAIQFSQTVFEERASLPLSTEFVTTKEKYLETMEQDLPAWKATLKAAQKSANKSNPASDI